MNQNKSKPHTHTQAKGKKKEQLGILKSYPSYFLSLPGKPGLGSTLLQRKINR